MDAQLTGKDDPINNNLIDTLKNLGPLEFSNHKFTSTERCPACNEHFLKAGKLDKGVTEADQIGFIHQACLYPYWAGSLFNINLKIRCYSIGDTIATTPVIREIKRLYPECKLTVTSYFPDLFKYHPDVACVLDYNHPIPIKIDQAHQSQVDGFAPEKKQHYSMHNSEHAFQSAFSKSGLPTDWENEVYYSPKEQNEMLSIIKEAGIDPEKDKVIVLHPHRTEWKTRDWGAAYMPALCERIKKEFPEYKIASIGGKRGEVISHVLKNYIKLNGVTELYGKLSLLQSIAFLDQPFVKLLVTSDTGTLHMGSVCRELPIVVAFTLIKSFFRTPVRNGIFGYKFEGVNADDPCNCTYDAKSLTHSGQINHCPKKRFLFKTLDMRIPAGYKIQGLHNLFPTVDWQKESLTGQIKKEITKYDGRALPCFPSVEKVFNSVRKLLQNP